MRFLPRLAALPLLLALPLSAGKRPFTIEDLYRLKGVSGLALSPDGARLAFELSSTDLKAAKRNTDLWMLDLASGQLKQLTHTPGSERAARWSADGKELAFLTGRQGGPQLWVLPLEGGESRKVTAFAPGVGEARLAGPSSAIFSSTVFPEAGADGAKNTAWSEKLEKGPVQAYLADSLLYRHWDSWRNFQYTHLFRATFDGKVEALTSGTLDQPGYGQSFTVSPEGSAVVFATNTDPVPATSTNQDLFLVDLKGDRAPRKLTTNPGYDGDPAFSPDGRLIAYRFQTRPGHESDRFRLAVLDRATGTARTLTEGIDNWVEPGFQWSADGTHLWFTVQEKGRWPLYRAEVATGKLERMLEGQAIREFAVTPDGGSVVFTRSTVGEPVEVWRHTFATRKTERLTAFNQAVADEVDIRPAEELWIPGADGKPIHCFVVKPHGFDPAKKYPLILNIHGGPQMMWADSFRGDWQVYPGAGYVVAFPNPHGSTGYGQAFTDAISGDWDGKCMTDVLKVTDHLAKLPYVDAQRMGAMGWSWGGYAMMWLQGRTPKFKAMAAMMGVYDLRSMHGATEELWFPQWDLKGTPWSNPKGYERQTPSNQVPAYKTPTLVITGERDYRVPYTQSLQFFTDLQLMKVPSRLIVFKNDGHWPDNLTSMPVYYNAHLEWFAHYLGGGKAPWSTELMIRNRAFGE